MRIPLWLEMNGRRVLVVGGGSVGTRRALMFRRAGAEVRVVAKWFSGKLAEEAERDEGIRLVEADAGNMEALEPHIEWADIVVIATDNEEVNRKAWSLAKKHRKWVNDATNAERTEVVVPYAGEVFDGGLRVAVTSEGKTGVAARNALKRIIKCLEEDNALKTLYEAMKRLKPVLKKHVATAKQRIPIYYEVEEQIHPLIEQGKPLDQVLEAIAAYLEKRLAQLGAKTSREQLLQELRQSQ
ncbi:MAG: NAD(P)-dependent oxidoreductase [Pyrodictiaceae archaeon]